MQSVSPAIILAVNVMEVQIMIVPYAHKIQIEIFPLEYVYVNQVSMTMDTVPNAIAAIIVARIVVDLFLQIAQVVIPLIIE
jgi:hypothetical protein